MSRTVSLAASATLTVAWGLHAAYLSHRLRRSQLDPLTGLYTRHEFTRRARRVLHHSPDSTVLLVDVDGFKNINDSLGHEVGDILLAVIADRLRQAVPDAVVARLGGDEFVAVTPQHGWVEVAAIAAALARPVLHPHGVTTPGVSLGAATGPHRTGVSAALRQADAAMYSAKTSGGGAARFDPYQHPPAHGRAQHAA